MYQNCYPGMSNVQMNPYQIMPNQSPSITNLKFIDRMEDITPRDIPMDGCPGIFPFKDKTAIILKQWTSDGTIQTVEYRPVIVPNEPKEDPINSKLDEILTLLNSKKGAAG